MARNKNNQAIWNKRIKKNTSKLFQEIGSSINVDKRLFKEDIQASLAHVEMLHKQKIISSKIKNKIIKGLKKIEKQILFTCKDIKPDAIKIGMLHSSKVVMSVVNALKKVKTSKIVLDPVMVAKSGARLINQRAIKTLKEKLIRKAYLITPNIPEAEILTKIKIRNLEDMIYAANILLKLGAKNVLIKGGHKNTKYMEDVLLSRKEIKIFKNKKNA